MLKIGMRLKSQVCETQVIVVRGPKQDIVLSCGGHPLIEMNAEPTTGLTLDPAHSDGTPLGKRFTLPEQGELELLVTRAGTGSLAADGTRLVIKDARALPASD